MDKIHELLLYEYKNPINKGFPVLEKETNPVTIFKKNNHTCGDTIEVCLLKDGECFNIFFYGHLCSVAQASASLMSKSLSGKKITQINKILKDLNTPISRDVDFDKCVNLTLYKRAVMEFEKYPTRKNCLNLPWLCLWENLPRLTSDFITQD